MEIKNFEFIEGDEKFVDMVATIEIIFKGELIGTEDFETTKFRNLKKKIKDDAESKIIYLNLSDVHFWDTEGMRNTLVFANDINSEYDEGDYRVIIVAPKNGYLYKRAIEKFEDSLTHLKWIEEIEQ